MHMPEIDWKTELELYENNSIQLNDKFQSSLSDFPN
jgi:hypothetical protein